MFGWSHKLCFSCLQFRTRLLVPTPAILANPSAANVALNSVLPSTSGLCYTPPILFAVLDNSAKPCQGGLSGQGGLCTRRALLALLLSLARLQPLPCLCQIWLTRLVPDLQPLAVTWLGPDLQLSAWQNVSLLPFNCQPCLGQSFLHCSEHAQCQTTAVMNKVDFVLLHNP